MKKLLSLILGITLVFGIAFLINFEAFAIAEKPAGVSCTTIQDGELRASDGSIITVGYDSWGYNYQARLFKGGYCDAYRDAEWCQESREDSLLMKWNDAWLSNKDCDGDGKLDRHYGLNSYIDSGAWLTNIQNGSYEKNGETCDWNYFVKIVAVPSDAENIDGIWYNNDGGEIGKAIWGEFALTMEVYNDSCTGEHGVEYKSPVSVGLGVY